MLGTAIQDLRYAARGLRKSPGFTAVAALTLALGIGANATMFSLLDAVVLKTLPVKKPEQLVLFNWLSGPNPMYRIVMGDFGRDPDTGLTTSTAFSHLAFERLRDYGRGLVDVFAFAPRPVTVNVGGEAESASGQLVSGNYYETLGVPAALGRTIAPADDRPDAGAVAVITYRYWQRRFGLDPAVIGKTVQVDGVSFTVVGITPHGFEGTLQVGESPDVSIPLAMEPRLSPDFAAVGKPWVWWLYTMGRLKPGVSAEAADANLELVFQQSAQEGWVTAPPVAQPGGPPDVPRLRAVDGSQGLTELRRKHARSLTILMTLVGTVLLIACGNVANLLLARAEARRKEMAVRLALGSGRWRTLRQLLTESLLLAGIGGALGVALAEWGRRAILALRPFGGADLDLDVTLDWRVLAFTTGLSALTALLFGLAPALRSTRVDLNSALKDHSRTSGGSRTSPLTQGLVIGQVALTLVLLITAGLFTLTLRNLQTLDAGFNRDHLLTFGIEAKGKDQVQVAQTYERVLERLHTLPGVQAAALSQFPVLAGGPLGENDATISIQGEAPPASERRTLINYVGPTFLETLGIPMVRGRGLATRDDRRAPKVAVINEAMARRVFGNADPIGRRFRIDGPDPSGDIEIVGIARNAKYLQLRGEMPPTAYLSYFQAQAESACFVVRVVGKPESLIPAVRQAVREVDGNLAMVDVGTLDQQVARGWAQERAFAGLSGSFGLLALLLATIGLYGVIAYGVAQRTREIGVRVALGARAGDVLGLVLRRGMKLVGLGVLVGLAGAFASTRVLRSVLYGVSPTNAVTFIVVPAILFAVALLACYLPARRAARCDPMRALRYE